MYNISNIMKLSKDILPPFFLIFTSVAKSLSEDTHLVGQYLKRNPKYTVTLIKLNLMRMSLKRFSGATRLTLNLKAFRNFHSTIDGCLLQKE
jgi:hypothetical protein